MTPRRVQLRRTPGMAQRQPAPKDMEAYRAQFRARPAANRQAQGG
jgi:hypothetical protein